MDAPQAADLAAMAEMVKWAFEEPPPQAFPATLRSYLQAHDFKCTPPPKVAQFPLHPYEIQYFQKVLVQALPDGTHLPPRPDPAKRQLMALFVKMVEAQKVQPPPAGPHSITHQAIHTFTPGNFVSLDLLHPPARLVVTVQLSGCSFVIGYDKASPKSILHVGHAQPSQGGDISHSKDLVKQFESSPLDQIFEGKKLSKVKVVGGFGSTIAKVIGWISNGKLFLAIKTPTKLDIQEFP